MPRLQPSLLAEFVMKRQKQLYPALIPTAISSLEQAIAAQNRIMSAGTGMLLDAIGIGDWLCTVKDTGRGDWCKWKTNPLGVSQQTISNYVRLSEHKDKLLIAISNSGPMGLTEAYGWLRKELAGETIEVDKWWASRLP